MNQFKFLVFVVFLSSCHQQSSNHELTSNSQQSIINGRILLERDLFSKHIVGIFKKGQTLCTGVLISQTTVLTAAHCIDDVKKGSISFGRDIKHLQLRPIVDQIQHPDFDQEIIGIIDRPANDLMVVQFKGEIPSGYEPVRLSDQDLVTVGTQVIIAGYGRDEHDEYDYLKLTEVQVVEAEKYEFRTDEKKTGSCDGDSGGPVFFKNSDEQFTFVGSVSRGDMNCNQYGIYENMAYYKNWILDSVHKLEVK